MLTIGAIRQRDRAIEAEAMARTELARTQRAEANATEARDHAERESERARHAQRLADRQATVANLASREARRDRDRAVKAEAISSRELARAVQAESNALTEGNTAKAVRDFLLGLFDDMNAATPGARLLTAYALLERGKAKIDTELADQPVVQATLIRTLGKIYDNIGDLDNAKRLYRSAITMERDPARGRSVMLAQNLSALALAESNSGNHMAAEAPAREALALQIKLHGADSREVGETWGVLGLTLNGLRKPTEARTALENSLSVREKASGKDSEDAASAAHNLGQFYAMQGEWQTAVMRYQQAIDIKTRIFGREHPRVYHSVEGLGQTLWRAKRLSEADTVLAGLYDVHLRTNGRDSERFASAANALANVRYDLGQFADARLRFEEAVAATSAPPPDSRSFRHSSYLYNLAMLLEESGEYAQAEHAYRQVISLRERLLDKNNLTLARTWHKFGRFQLQRGNLLEATKYLQAALPQMQFKRTPNDADNTDAQLASAELAMARGATMEARAAMQSLVPSNDAPPVRHIAYLRAAALLASAEGRLVDAAALWGQRATLSEKQHGAPHPWAALARFAHVRALIAAGRQSEARDFQPLLVQVFTMHFREGSAHRAALAMLFPM